MTGCEEISVLYYSMGKENSSLVNPAIDRIHSLTKGEVLEG